MNSFLLRAPPVGPLRLPRWGHPVSGLCYGPLCVFLAFLPDDRRCGVVGYRDKASLEISTLPLTICMTSNNLFNSVRFSFPRHERRNVKKNFDRVD